MNIDKTIAELCNFTGDTKKIFPTVNSLIDECNSLTTVQLSLYYTLENE